MRPPSFPRVLSLTAVLAASLLVGCGDGPSVASLSLSAAGAENGAAPCPRGGTVALTLTARDGSGEAIALDPGSVEWSVSDDTALSLQATASGAVVTALTDRFDGSGGEPRSTVTACAEDRCASIDVLGVINASGTWLARLDNGLSLSLELEQSGRAVTDANSGYGGLIMDDGLTLSVSGFTVDATFVSRTEVTGTYGTPSGTLGTLTCTKQ